MEGRRNRKSVLDSEYLVQRGSPLQNLMQDEPAKSWRRDFCPINEVEALRNKFTARQMASVHIVDTHIDVL